MEDSEPPAPALDENFPDPGVICVEGRYHAFSTNSGGKLVPSASLNDEGRWIVNPDSALACAAAWSIEPDHWAPAVSRLDDGSFIMYYSARTKGPDDSFHCIGAATSSSVLGPYTPTDEPIACHLSEGGAIDPVGFHDSSTGDRYFLYKIDGNHIGPGTGCKNNGPDPSEHVPTPIMLQQVEQDGLTKIGEPMKILDRGADSDGPLIEAPSLYRHSEPGKYFLFFSSGCFLDPSYTVKYATADCITGPYTRAADSLLKTGSLGGLRAPGGADIADDGSMLVFHADQVGGGRAMYAMSPRFDDAFVTIGSTGD